MVRKSRCHKSGAARVDWLSHFQGGNAAYIDISFGVPSIMGGLHSNPDAGTSAKQFPDAHSNLRRDRLPLCHNIMEVLPRNPEQLRNLDLLLARRRQHILAEHGAGVGRASIEVRPGGIFGHFYSPLPLWSSLRSSPTAMILFVVHTIGIPVFKFERDAPWSVDMNGITNWLPAQPVEIEAK